MAASTTQATQAQTETGGSSRANTRRASGTANSSTRAPAMAATRAMARPAGRPATSAEHPQADGEYRQHGGGAGGGGADVRRRAGDRVGRQPRGGGGPGRDGEGQYPPGESGLGPGGAGGEREEEARHADGEGADDGQVAGVERVGDSGHPDGDGDDRRVHGLGDEEPGDPFDVGDDPAALVQHPRDGGEGPVQQHHPGHRAARLAARSHRDTEICLLEGLDVVDAVAHHRDHVAAGLQRPHGGELVAGPDPVGCQNCASGRDLGSEPARSYSLRRPPSTGRRLTRSWERSATGWSGRGGWRRRARCGLRPL